MPSSQTVFLIIGLAILGILIWLLSLISSSINDNDPNGAGNATDERNATDELQYHTQRQQSVTAIANAIDAHRRSRHSEERGRSERDKVMIAVLGATAIFALLAAGAAIYSAWIFSGQLNESKAESRLTERAFVNIRELSSKELWRGARQNAPDDVLWDFTPVFENTGRTPSVNVQMVIITPILEPNYYNVTNPPSCDPHKANMSSISQKEYEISSPADPDIVFSWEEDRKKPFLIDLRYIGPNRSIAPAGTHWLETIAGFQCATWWFYFGSIHYDDFFGEPHISKFCFLVNPAALGGLDQPQAPYIQPCAHWNCMDDSCIKDAEQYKASIGAVDHPK